MAIFAADGSVSSEEKTGRLQKLQSSLIVGLISQNEKPNTRHETFPASYDRQRQASVFVFAMQLTREDVHAVHALLSIKDDERYAASFATPFGITHFSVRGLAMLIVKRMTLLDQHVTPQWLVRRAWPFERARAWLEETQFESLADLQTKSIEKQIQLLKELQFVDGIRQNRYTPSLSVEEFDNLRTQILKELDAIRLQLRESGKPILPESLDSEEELFWGLPWSPRETPWG
jgi:hypothetical protein